MFQIYHISALYIGKLQFIINQSEDTKVTHFVTPVAQFPKGNMIRCIAQSCQSMPE